MLLVRGNPRRERVLKLMPYDRVQLGLKRMAAAGLSVIAINKI